MRSRPLFGDRGTITTIPGAVANFTQKPAGCPFHPRCEFAFDRCAQDKPEAFSVNSDHLSRCWLLG
jgi:oligopeptide/dipeptide ABC transporter ATP-binding protein